MTLKDFLEHKIPESDLTIADCLSGEGWVSMRTSPWDIDQEVYKTKEGFWIQCGVSDLGPYDTLNECHVIYDILNPPPEKEDEQQKRTQRRD